jgi:hypothetical protein
MDADDQAVGVGVGQGDVLRAPAALRGRARVQHAGSGEFPDDVGDCRREPGGAGKLNLGQTAVLVDGVAILPRLASRSEVCDPGVRH